MFSFFKKVVSTVFFWGSDHPVNTDEDEQAILHRINSINFDGRVVPRGVETATHEQPFGQSDPVTYDFKTFKCTHKAGKVTHLCHDYGIIDNVTYFEPDQICNDLKLKLDDEVLYSAYRLKENEVERVYKVYGLKNDPMDFGDPPTSVKCTNNLQETEELSAFSRVITGRVTQRRGWEVFVESADLWCNLNKINASFIPVEGDWVELQAIVTVDEEAENLRGDILEVMSLKPLLVKNGSGRITFWSDFKKEGAVENFIYFTHNSCEDGFIPSLGEEVLYEAVESDQERFRWRALKLVPKFVKSGNRAVVNDEGDMGALMSDKNGISIKPFLITVEVELNEVKVVPVEVTNSGTDRQLLVRISFLRSKNSQMKLVSPQKSSFYIDPQETVTFQFECEGKVLGLTGEMISFNFKNFVIAKRLEIKVSGNKEMNKLLDCKFGTVFKFFEQKPCVIDGKEAEVLLYGPKPWTPPKFVSKEKKCFFKIPKKLWNLRASHQQEVKFKKQLLQYAPYFKENLSFANYADWFHTLLCLEEMELRLNFRIYSLKEVYLYRCDDFLVLEVPGLVEKRPSLMIGDKIILSQPWSEGHKTKHIGYIHDIQEKEVYVKFHSSFHDTYNQSECDIEFEPNMNYFSKAHEAVNRAVRTLGQQWLFPSTVTEKSPKIDFDVIFDSEAPLPGSVTTFFEKIPKNQQQKSLSPCPTLTEVESKMKDTLRPPTARKKLTWANKMLNNRQKLAVVNVLKGQGRPLPYIIFGPPGTGKTITLVEIIIQIYRLIPDSRILITTPSNSSADLLCERLIDSANFQPGQLVRLLAVYRVHDGLVPAKIIPYSAYYGQKGCSSRRCSERCYRDRVKHFSVNELAGRHRITVATCVAISFLHYQGLPAGHFTHILVDEAGQTSEPEVLLSTTFQNVEGGQVVLTGDPQQLGPVIFNAVAKSFGLDISLMQRLMSRFPYTKDTRGFPETSGFDPRFITKLVNNYRSVPEILSLPNEMFYNSELIPVVSQTDSPEATIIQKFNFKKQDSDSSAAIIFHGIVGQNYQEKDSPSWFNPHEIWQVIFYLGKLYSVGLKDADVGIVTPYAKQVHKLKKLLRSLKMAVPKVGSVEEFQGQERLAIIVSTVRSSPEFLRSDIVHSLGFVSSPQRLNVVLTRARALLIIIGNPVLLSHDPSWVNVVKYCVKNSSYTGCDVDVLTGKAKPEVELEDEVNGSKE